jgi:hypothetical protein
MISPTMMESVAKMLSLKSLSQVQLDTIEDALNEKGYNDARAKFAVYATITCGNHDHPFDVLPHILRHGDDWRPPSHNKPRPEPDPDEVRQQQRYEMVNAVRRANVLALVLQLPLVAIPDEWTRKSPEEESWFTECMAKLEGKPLSQMVRELAERRAMRDKADKPAEPMLLEDTPENRETLRVMVSKLGVDGTRERMRHYANIDIVLAKAQSVTKEVP